MELKEKKYCDVRISFDPTEYLAFNANDDIVACEPTYELAKMEARSLGVKNPSICPASSVANDLSGSSSDD